MDRSPPDVHERRARRLAALYRRAARLLPAALREASLDDAVADVESLVLRASHRTGRWAAWRTAGAALLDLGKRVPAERWADGVRSVRSSNRSVGDRMTTWTMELGRAARALARRPGYTFVAALTLALGIGANVAIFAVVGGVVLKPLPYPDADRIVVVEHHAPGIDLPDVPQSQGTSLMYAREVKTFGAFGSFATEGRNLAGDDGAEARRVTALVASAGLFPVLGVRPALGRALVPEDSEPGAPAVALLAHDLWQERYGGDVDVVGRTVRLDGGIVEVVGVLPEDFRLPDERFDVMEAMELDPAEGFGSFSHAGVARLAEGVTIEQARAEVEALQARIPELFPDLTAAMLESFGWSVTLTPLLDEVVSDIATTLWILMGTVGLVFLIAAANVANLVLVRTEGRQREVAVRTALGAGRGALLRTFLAESALLGVGGGVAGVAVAALVLRLVLALAPAGLPRRADIALDPLVLAFGAALTALVALGFGLLPMARVRAREVGEVLKEGLRGSTSGPGALRGRNALVVVQLALALVLVAGSGLLLRSFLRLRAVDPGLDPEGVSTLVVSLDRRYAEEGAAWSFYSDLLTQTAALPGVVGVGMIDDVPLAGRGMSAGSFEVEGWDRDEDAPPVVSLRKTITPGFFEAMGIPIERGEAPVPGSVERREPVAWVNAELARRFLGDRPVGARIRQGDEDPWLEVAGVVGDTRDMGLDEAIRPTIYHLVDGPDLAQPALQMTLVVRGPPAAAVVGPVRDILAGLDPGVPLSVTETMDEILARDLASTSFTLVLLALAGAMSLVLGTVGIYGVISYVVGQRTRELGVRMALGARGADVRRMVVTQGLVLTGVGLAVGLGAALALTRVLRSVLFEVSATDPLVLVATALLLLAVSMMATYLPARRASRVDPVDALRAE
jgi:predicted permease